MHKVAKANLKTSTGGINPQPRQNSDKPDNFRTDDKVAEDIGLGSRDTYMKMVQKKQSNS
ncbi:hypothetical protein [Clostridium estertheticum]|uniref:hypothetical protein n=1 Tax=Clostridium estertheticum TaxID=238834 RepID=UPI001C7D5CB0|nr:hypothetical protein [Clostridium estertheticum]MBX4271456.1 hypothetical protein [Clostridium estertheticum]